MFGLMMENKHTEQSSGAAAKYRYPQQCTLADTTQLMSGFVLVNAIHKKGYQIDTQRIKRQYVYRKTQELCLFSSISPPL